MLLVDIEGFSLKEVKDTIERNQVHFDFLFSDLEEHKEENEDFIKKIIDLSEFKYKNKKEITDALRERLDIFYKWKKKSLFYIKRLDISFYDKKVMSSIIDSYFRRILLNTKEFSVVSFLPATNKNYYIQWGQNERWEYNK